jgi:predicted metal-dependent hydrolase
MDPIFKTLFINEQKVQLIRKKIKNVNISVCYVSGKITVTAPIKLSEKRIVLEVNNKFSWIQKQLNRFEIMKRNEPLLLNNEILLWGEKIKKESISTQNIEELYKNEALTAISQHLFKWEEKLCVRANQVRIKKMKSRWGSCNYTTRNLNFNSLLAKFPPRCLDYVVLHELAHLIEPSHNQKFKRILSEHMADWQIWHKILKNYSAS